MQPAASASPNKPKFANRQIREQYLKNVNVKLISGGGYDKYLRLGCIEAPKAVIAVTKAKIVHEPCNRDLFKIDENQRSKVAQNEAGVQTVDNGTENNYHLEDTTMVSDGRGCVPLQMRRKYLLASRTPSNIPGRNASETSLALGRNNQKNINGNVTTQQGRSRYSFKDLWNQGTPCLRNAVGGCEACMSPAKTNSINPPTFLRTLGTSLQPNINLVTAEVMKQFKYDNTLKAQKPDLLDGYSASTAAQQIHQTSFTFASSPENSGLHAEDSPCQPQELPRFLKTDCVFQDNKMETEIAPVEAQPQIKTQFSCIHKDGDDFVIRRMDAVKEGVVCLDRQQAGTAVFAIQN